MKIEALSSLIKNTGIYIPHKIINTHRKKI
jgi:hypothetical protein